MPEPSGPPQSPPRRLGLWAPYLALALLAAVGGAGWLMEKSTLEQSLDAAALRLKAQGFSLTWTARRVDGFPFRLDLTLDAPRLSQASGWTVSAPQLKGEAYAYSPDRWIFVAPQGLTLSPPGAAPIAISGQAIRASLSGVADGASRFSLEGVKLAFAPPLGRAPLGLSAADHLELHWQAGPDDQAAVLLRIDGASQPGAPLALSSLMWDSRLSHVSQLSGPDWPSAVRRWSAAGGTMTVVRAGLGGTTLSSDAPARLGVGPDGRLSGDLPLVAQHGSATTLSFRSGRTLVGPIPAGPAPQVY